VQHSLLGDWRDGAEDAPSQNCIVFSQLEEDLKKVMEVMRNAVDGVS